MAADFETRIERRIDDLKVIVHRRAPGFLELVENMVVRRRGQNSGLGKPHLLDDLEVRFHRANPSGDFGELVATREASIHRLAIGLRVQEELGLPDNAVGAAEAMQHVEHRDDLPGGIRRTRLLSVAEGGVGNEKIRRRIGFLEFTVEDNSRHRIVRELLADEIRLRHVDQFVFHGRILDLNLNRINQHMSSDIQDHL